LSGHQRARANRTRRRRWLRAALQVAVVTIGLAVATVVLRDHVAELSGAAAALGHLRWQWVTLAALAELASIVAYASLQRRLLRAGGVAVGLGPMTAITLAGNAIQNSFPGGPAWSAVYAFRQFRDRGADSVLAGWAMFAVAILSDLALVAVALAGLGLAEHQAASLDLVSVLVAAPVVVVVIVGVVHRAMASGMLGRLAVPFVRLSQRVFHRPVGEPSEIVARLVERVGAVTPGRRQWAIATAWSVLNWLFDCACLLIAFPAVHAAIPWRALLLAYGAGQLAANLPVTPGGLGVVEGSLTIALVVYGGAASSTISAVLLYRLISFWALLAAGWVSWGVLRWRRR
jgi:uncharacterized protein (TIRG00374 family)